ncbi:hypothetical protein SMC26_26140 [Actinomadura fulvescens]|uniref:PE-PGRS family protein n=1 Tax=Actinomadura fulvescens TaxID=46160 RepID=A0ABN3Q8Y8_9ACTN
MTQSYPIIEERFLREPPKRGAFGLRGRRRDYDELPRPKGNQVLVFCVGGKHLVDDGRFGLDDERVLEATSVSLVDISDRVPVTIQLAIPSKDSSEFTIQAAFLCTVTDPEVIVGKGKQNVSVSLLGYLRGHHRIFELGLPYELSEIHEVRRDVKAQVLAYTMKAPAPIPGMKVVLNSIEVLTPNELREVHGRLRKGSNDQRVVWQEKNHGHDLERLHAEQAHLLERMNLQFERERADHDRKMEEQRRLFDEWMEQEIGRLRRVHAQQEYAELAPLFGSDPLEAMKYAVARGDLPATEIVRALEEARERDRGDSREVWQERLADQRERDRATREERRWLIEIQQEARREDRADQRLSRQHDRTDEQHRRQMVQRVIGKLADAGYLDENSPDVRLLVQGLMQELVPGSGVGEKVLDSDALEARSLDPAAPEEELREEDVN